VERADGGCDHPQATIVRSLDDLPVRSRDPLRVVLRRRVLDVVDALEDEHRV
jgi:hypothetical protein